MSSTAANDFGEYGGLKLGKVGQSVAYMAPSQPEGAGIAAFIVGSGPVYCWLPI
jgi:hypothetical protein